MHRDRVGHALRDHGRVGVDRVDGIVQVLARRRRRAIGSRFLGHGSRAMRAEELLAVWGKVQRRHLRVGLEFLRGRRATVR